MTEYYNSNPNLKSANTSLQYTEYQIQEYIKCKSDPVYFVNNYCKIITLDNGLVPFKLYECQKNKLNVIHNNRKVILMEGRQQGKCFRKNTNYKVRNKLTGETLYVSAEEFHQMNKKL